MTIRMIPIIASSCALLSVSSAADLPENMTQKTADRVEAISNRAMLLAKTKFEDFRNGRLTDLDRFAISSYQQFLVVHPEATLAIEDIVGWDGGVGVLRRDTKKNITPVAHASNQTQVHIILPKSLLSKIRLQCGSSLGTTEGRFFWPLIQFDDRYARPMVTTCLDSRETTPQFNGSATVVISQAVSGNMRLTYCATYVLDHTENGLAWIQLDHHHEIIPLSDR